MIFETAGCLSPELLPFLAQSLPDGGPEVDVQVRRRLPRPPRERLVLGNAPQLLAIVFLSERKEESTFVITESGKLHAFPTLPPQILLFLFFFTALSYELVILPPLPPTTHTQISSHVYTIPYGPLKKKKHVQIVRSTSFRPVTSSSTLASWQTAIVNTPLPPGVPPSFPMTASAASATPVDGFFFASVGDFGRWQGAIGSLHVLPSALLIWQVSRQQLPRGQRLSTCGPCGPCESQGLSE